MDPKLMSRARLAAVVRSAFITEMFSLSLYKIIFRKYILLDHYIKLFYFGQKLLYVNQFSVNFVVGL